MAEETKYMERAVELALKGSGRTSPNPIVGAVIVNGGEVVGEGFHRRAGSDHAEIVALRDAGAQAQGADLYVTLEPCCHDGRTPPCVDAIADRGIARVYLGTRDPNPRVDGKGIKALKAYGVDVVEGVMKDECTKINRAYNKFIRSGRPFVTAKVALTLDGKIAASSGHSRWITNAECRRYVHELRAMSDAVMVGGGTVRADDPMLDVRTARFTGSGPRAVVLDEELDLPRKSRLFERPDGDLIVITTGKAKASRIKWIESRGHDVIVCRQSNGTVDAEKALEELGKRGILSVMLEGGGGMYSTFVRRRLVDRFVVCIAPKLVGADGIDFLPGVKTRNMDDAIALEDIEVKNIGDNVVIEGSPRWR